MRWSGPPLTSSRTRPSTPGLTIERLARVEPLAGLRLLTTGSEVSLGFGYARTSDRLPTLVAVRFSTAASAPLGMPRVPAILRSAYVLDVSRIGAAPTPERVSRKRA